MLSQLLIMVCLWYTIFTIALASICINQVHFPHTLDILAQSYELKGMVRCASHHFTKAINNHTEWICIDVLFVSEVSLQFRIFRMILLLYSPIIFLVYKSWHVSATIYIII